jgi:hypothetical protein
MLLTKTEDNSCRLAKLKLQNVCTTKPQSVLLTNRHQNTQHNDTQQSDIQYNVTQR